MVDDFGDEWWENQLIGVGSSLEVLDGEGEGDIEVMQQEIVLVFVFLEKIKQFKECFLI